MDINDAFEHMLEKYWDYLPAKKKHLWKNRFSNEKVGGDNVMTGDKKREILQEFGYQVTEQWYPGVEIGRRIRAVEQKIMSNAKIENRTRLYGDINAFTKAIKEVLKISPRRILGPDRKSEVCLPRHMLCYVMVEKEGFTPSQVSRAIGKAHSTILHGIATHEELTPKNWRGYADNYKSILKEYEKLQGLSKKK